MLKIKSLLNLHLAGAFCKIRTLKMLTYAKYVALFKNRTLQKSLSQMEIEQGFANHLLQPIADISVEAGRLIMEHYLLPHDITIKEDKSPVTAADIAANTHIVTALEKLTPQYPVVAEENTLAINDIGIGAECFWLVDPLDGTRSFIKRNGAFTVNIALIHQGAPVLGAVYVPITETLYYGSMETGAYRKIGDAPVEKISARHEDDEGAVVIASMSHLTPETEAYIHSLKIKSWVSASSSVKFCLVAEGSADIYPRFGRTMEWDTAAGHAVLLAAGGSVTNMDGSPLAYGKDGFENPYFIAHGLRK